MPKPSEMKDMLEAKNRLPQKAEEKDQPTIIKLIQQMTPAIQKAIPKHMSAERMARIATTLVRITPKLAQCTPESFLGALMTATQLGLEPGPLGECYLIPYYSKKRKRMECQFQMGYKGYLRLFYNSESSVAVEAHEVHENDYFEYEYGYARKLVHKPVLENRGKVIAYYAVAFMKNGTSTANILSRDDVEKYRKRSQSPNDGPWVTDYDAMAKKTAIKHLLKYLPLSSELTKAVSSDESTKSRISDDMGEVEDEGVFDIFAEEINDETAEKEDGSNETEIEEIREVEKVDEPENIPIINKAFKGK